MALTTNLVSYWKLNESSGNAADSVGTNTLTNNNSTPYAAAKINSGADLERGSTQFFSITDAAQSGLDFTTAFTIALWVKFESVTTLVREPFMARWDANSGNRWLFTKDDSNIILFAIGDDATATFSSVAWTPSAATWYFVVVTYSAGTIKFYIDGVQQGADKTTSFTSLPNSSYDLNVGKYPDGAPDYFDGIMDEIGMWSRALLNSEIAFLYNGGAGLTYPFSGFNIALT